MRVRGRPDRTDPSHRFGRSKELRRCRLITASARHYVYRRAVSIKRAVQVALLVR
jgi:hypothetical protein